MFISSVQSVALPLCRRHSHSLRPHFSRPRRSSFAQDYFKQPFRSICVDGGTIEYKLIGACKVCMWQNNLIIISICSFFNTCRVVIINIKPETVLYIYYSSHRIRNISFSFTRERTMFSGNVRAFP